MRNSVFPLALTGLICWIFSLAFPFASVERLGIENRSYLTEIGHTFRANGHFLLGIASDLLLLVFPTVFFAANVASPFSKNANLLLGHLKAWAMPDVFALSLLVAFVKLDSLASTRTEAGFYFLFAAVLLMSVRLHRDPPPVPSLKKCRTTALALLVSAAILLVPANMLPIMNIRTASGTIERTIMGGIADLSTHGLWGIAAIVFVASILVPFGKLGGLAWLLSLEKGKTRNGFPQKLYHSIDFIGRWSMLDIFLIGSLASLVDFGRLASISPGPAAPAFAAAVVLTVVAVERFEISKQITDSKL